MEMETGGSSGTDTSMVVGRTIQVVPVSTARPATEAIHKIVQRGLDDDDSSVVMESAAADSRDEEVDTKIDIYHIGGSEVVSQVNWNITVVSNDIQSARFAIEFDLITWFYSWQTYIQNESESLSKEGNI